MRCFRFLWATVIQTLLRLLPFPCKTGLLKLGNPDRTSPVLLTCNFQLTVERVKRALHGIDAYLLVANSRGVNVWCAAAGGLLTNHDVIAVLKTSDVQNLVDHRRVVLPQLAAVGIEAEVIREKTGWTVIWGPVEASAIPAFVRRGFKKSASMRTVTFPWPHRLEVAVAWAFPISLFSALVWLFWPSGVLPLIGFVWASSLLLFLGFPLYQRHLGTEGKNIGFVFFDFGRRGIPLLLWVAFMLAVTAYASIAGEVSWPLLLRWGLSSLAVLMALGLDLRGSTPTHKSGLHDDRLLRIALDTQRCNGDARCQNVCPKNVFEIDTGQHVALIARATECVQCGACIVQCPSDALYFQSPEGKVVAPVTIRRHKLDLLGRRRAKDAMEA